MTPESVMTLGRTALEMTILVASPVLLVTLVVGLIVSVFQAATQINEMTLSFVPKLVAIFITLAVAGPWMITMITDFTKRLIGSIPSLIG